MSLSIENLGQTDVVDPWVVVNGRRDWFSVDTLLAETLHDGMSDREKAFAIWSVFKDNFYHYNAAEGQLLNGVIHSDLYDPIKNLNIYENSGCSCHAINLATLWQAAGLNAEVWNFAYTHWISQVFYDGQYHMLDADMRVFYPRPADGAVASIEECIADRYLIKCTHCYGDFARTDPQDDLAHAGWYLDRNSGNPYQSLQGHTMGMRLRPGESIVRRWSNAGKFHDNSRHVASLPKFANGQLIYHPDLSSPTCLAGAENAVNFRLDRESGSLCAEKAGRPARLVYRVRAPWVIVGGRVACAFEVAPPGGSVALRFSYTGEHWWELHAGEAEEGALDVALDRYIATKHTNARYEYLLAIEVSPTADPRGVRLSSLEIVTDLQMSLQSLPALALGDNTVVYRDHSPGPRHIKVTHEWRESDANKLPRRVSELTGPDELRREAERLRGKTDDAVARSQLALIEGRIARLEEEGSWLARLGRIDAQSEELIADGVPEWAVAQREALAKYVLWIHWWIEHQQPDGQFGGGWEDDVELVCGWPLACLAASDKRTFDSLALLAHGVWSWGPISRHGYSTYTDVEHSAEDTSYSQPRMVVLDYGNPLYLDRCRKTTLIVARESMGENDRGRLQFRSSFFGYRADQPAIGEERPFDIPECAKALKPGLAVLWHDPAGTHGEDGQIREIILRYADTWVEAAMSPRKGGTPGLLPAKIDFPSGEPSGECAWIPVMRALHYHLLGCYQLTGDARYLQPIEALIREYVANRSVRDIPFTPQWRGHEHAGALSQLAVIASLWRILTDDDRFDAHFERWSRRMAAAMGPRCESYHFLDRAADDIWIREPIDVGAFRLPRLAIGPQFYVGWLASQDKGLLTAGCRNLSCDLSDQWGPLTSWFYDKSESRVTSNDHLAHSIQTAATMLMLMYTGGSGPIEARYPHLAVSWGRTTPDFAALVLEQSATHLKVLACNLEPAPRQVTMRVYELQPGTYTLRTGADADGDDRIDGTPNERVVPIRRHSPLTLDLPSRVMEVIELDHKDAQPDLPAAPPATVTFPQPDLVWRPDLREQPFLEEPTSPPLSAKGPFTVVARFVCEQGGHEQVIVGNAADRGYHGFALSLTEDNLPQFVVRYHAVVNLARASDPIPIGRPVTLAGVFTGAEQKLYISGRLAAKVANKHYTPSTGPLMIGAAWSKAPVLRFSGSIDEVAFFGRAVEPQ